MSACSDCLEGRTKGCVVCQFHHYWLPNLIKELGRLPLPFPFPPFRRGSLDELFDVDSRIAKYLGDPSPQPSIREARIQAGRGFETALTKTLASVKKELANLTK